MYIMNIKDKIKVLLNCEANISPFHRFNLDFSFPISDNEKRDNINLLSVFSIHYSKTNKYKNSVEQIKHIKDTCLDVISNIMKKMTNHNIDDSIDVSLDVEPNSIDSKNQEVICKLQITFNYSGSLDKKDFENLKSTTSTIKNIIKNKNGILKDIITNQDNKSKLYTTIEFIL